MDGNSMEILAPVGGREQLLAAVRCGADAVYLGAGGFNARRNAENFDAYGLPEAVRYCHERDVKVYVTVNTLVMDEELPALTETLDQVAEAGADGVIVQDLAVAKILRKRWPELPMHASTQMTIHNLEGVKKLRELGFSQAVLARELSAKEIGEIHRGSDMRLEVFVHGALCMCVSGACYLSSMIGTRSGNRGLCAQPCRMNFQCNGRPYALSLKDMTAIDKLALLEDAGVASLKIEGRMKRPEYVAAAVTACRQALRGEQPDMETLQAVFSRSGFTDGYLTGRRTIDMFGYRRKEDVTAAAGVLGSLSALYGAEKQTVPVDMRFSAHQGQPASLTVKDGAHAVTVGGAVPETARNVPLSEEAVKRSLSQTGGTPYYLRNLEADVDEGLSLPVSEQKRMRRDALTALGEERGRPPHSICAGAAPDVSEIPDRPAPSAPKLRLRFAAAEQAFSAPEAERVILPLKIVLQEPFLAEELGERLTAELPALCFPEQMPLLRGQLEQLQKMGVQDVLTGNLGLLALAREYGFTLRGDYGLNILNSIALETYGELGLADATVSFELAMAKIAKLRGTLQRGMIGYGYLPLMKVRACPARGRDGCGDCKGSHTLTDEKGIRFPFLCRERQYGELLNGTPLYIGDKRLSGPDFVTLRFTMESKGEAERAYHLFTEGAAPGFPRTNGLYYRELQ